MLVHHLPTSPARVEKDQHHQKRNWYHYEQGDTVERELSEATARSACGAAFKRVVNAASETMRPFQTALIRSSLLTTRSLFRIRESRRSKTCGVIGTASTPRCSSRRCPLTATGHYDDTVVAHRVVLKGRPGDPRIRHVGCSANANARARNETALFPEASTRPLNLTDQHCASWKSSLRPPSTARASSIWKRSRQCS